MTIIPELGMSTGSEIRTQHCSSKAIYGAHIGASTWTYMCECSAESGDWLSWTVSWQIAQAGECLSFSQQQN